MKIRDLIKDFVEFEDVTSITYPWAIKAEEILKNENLLNSIEKECRGYDDVETIYDAVDKVCGINPKLR